MSYLWPLFLYASAWLVFAYLCGSVSFAVVVSKVFGLSDPRTYGSHNPGATNVLRSGSKGAALITLLLDGLKGWLPLVLAKSALGTNAIFDASAWSELHGFTAWQSVSNWCVAGVAMAAFAGHLWPIFFGFKGGKGVATAAGLLIGMQPYLGLSVLITWLSVAAVTRYSSLAALLSASLAPIYWIVGVMYLGVNAPSTGGAGAQASAALAQPSADQITGAALGAAQAVASSPVAPIALSPWPFAAVSAAMAALLIYRHKDNIARLRAGEEGRIFSKKKQ